MSKNERRKAIPVEAHHRKIDGLFRPEPAIEGFTRRIHSPKLPIHGVTTELERLARDRPHQRMSYSIAARVRPDVKIADPQAFLGGMRLEALADQRIGHQPARDVRHQAIEPAFGTGAVSYQVGFCEARLGIADSRCKLARHIKNAGGIFGTHGANNRDISHTGLSHV